MKKIIAIRSLISPHHAEYHVPKIFSLNWYLGIRCNYDCSYCSPSLHDWVSPHIPFDSVKKFLVKVDDWASQQGKTIKYSLTGGEPFVHPDIIEILKAIRATNTCDDIFTAITNGSLPIDLYRNAFNSITNLTISLHFDRSVKEIENITDKIITLNREFPDKFITVQVMMLPGKFDYIQSIAKRFTENQVKHVYRRIRPFTEDQLVNVYQSSNKRKILTTKRTAEEQKSQTKNLKGYLQENILKIYQEGSYYSQEELSWLEENVPEVRWQNIGVWDEDYNYTEVNSDELVSKNLHRFKNWSCYAGVDSANIDHHGDIYRANCGVEYLGNLETFNGFCTDPVICPIETCISNPDQTTRKASPEFKWSFSDLDKKYSNN